MTDCSLAFYTAVLSTWARTHNNLLPVPPNKQMKASLKPKPKPKKQAVVVRLWQSQTKYLVAGEN